MTDQNEKPSKWHPDSILIKSAVIAVLIILLLIPSSWIQSLITDREGYQQQYIDKVSDQWSGSQLIQGPVLMLPYKKQVSEYNPQNKLVTRDVIKYLYVLPQTLKITGHVKTTPFQKGIYDATVYDAKLMVTGNFDKPDLPGAGIDPAMVLYDKARLVFSISDMKGLKNNPVLNLQGQLYAPEPAVDNLIPFDKGLQAVFSLTPDKDFSYSYNLDLKGSNELNFLHTGKSTDVEISSDWKSPNFNGRYLPDNHEKGDKGFDAKWHMLYYNRPFPQQWINSDTLLVSQKAKEAVFGVKLQLPIDQYRKIMRTAKYSTLIILLTFISLFLAELIKKQNVHVFNYILIGAAMVVYYILLLSFSEQMGFNLAYLISSSSTIILIAAFTASLLGNRNIAALFTFILSIFYGFIFIIIQLEDLALLFGGIALFIIIATLMFFSRKISWDKK